MYRYLVFYYDKELKLAKKGFDYKNDALEFIQIQKENGNGFDIALYALQELG